MKSTAWLFILFVAGAASHTDDDPNTLALYSQFHAKHRGTTTGTLDSVNFKDRVALFARTHANVQAHNANPKSNWVAEVNRFADFTHGEFHNLLNYRRTADWKNGDTTSRSSGFASSFLEHQTKPQVLQEEVDWRGKLKNSSATFYNQGSCGSCWAVAAATALQMHAELKDLPAPKLSYYQIVGCTDNPKHCGGTGGCKGATSALALEYVVNNPLASVDKYSEDYAKGCEKPQPGSALQITGYTKVQENAYMDVLRAVSEGPVVVSVDGSEFSSYKTGVFDSCSQDAVTNHAVVAVGYGRDQKKNKDYWLVRNSWGKDWGMDGFMQLERHHDVDAKGLQCGMDRNPQAGVACEGGPSEVKVCGMCGVLSHAVYPTGIHSVEIK